MDNKSIDTAVKALNAVQELDRIEHQDEINSLLHQVVEYVDHARTSEYEYNDTLLKSPDERE